MKTILKQKNGINLVVLVIVLMIGVILGSGIVYAAVSASQVSYTTESNDNIKNVGEALNDLYGNIDKNKVNNVTLHYGLRTNQSDGAVSSANAYVKNFKSITITNEEGSTIATRKLKVIYNNTTYSVSHKDSITISVVEGADILYIDSTGTDNGYFVGGNINLYAD